MAVGILKSKTVFVNRIAASLRETLKMKDVCKRLSSQYLKRDYAGKVLGAHLDRVCPTVGKDGFIVMDGTDISKKYSKFMEGLEQDLSPELDLQQKSGLLVKGHAAIF